MNWSKILEFLLPVLSAMVILFTILFDGQTKKKPGSHNYSQKYQIKNITIWGWILAFLLISLNIGTIYTSKENASEGFKTDSIHFTRIIDKLNNQREIDSVKIFNDSVKIANLNTELIGLNNYIHEQQFKHDSIQQANLNYLFKQLREENYVVIYNTFGADLAPSFYENSAPSRPFKTFFLKEYIDYSKSLEVVSYLTDYLNVIDQYNNLFEELNVVYTEEKKMYKYEMTAIQKTKNIEILIALKKISNPINTMLKKSSNIEEFDLKISIYVNNIIKQKKEKGIPDIKDMGGFLYD